MTDTVSKERRSEIMSKIHQPTTLETYVHGYLCGRHIRHRMYPKIEGNPDIELLTGRGSVYLFLDGCVPPETLILGANQTIEHCVQTQTCIGTGKRATITRTHVHQFDGKLLEIRATGLLPIQVTPSHPLMTLPARRMKAKPPKHTSWINFGSPMWKKADSLRAGDYLAVPKLSGTDVTAKIDLLPFIKDDARRKQLVARGNLTTLELTERSAWVLGLYVADGWSSRYGKVNFYLNANEAYVLAKLRAELSELRLKFGLRRRGNIVEVCAYSTALSRALPTWCGNGAANKVVPEFILFNRNHEVVRGFLDGYIAGDGHLRKHNNGNGKYYPLVVCGTVSKALALEIQLLLARLDIISSVRIMITTSKIWGRAVNAKTPYEVRFYPRSKGRGRVRITAMFHAHPIVSIASVPYSGPVHNLETTDHTYLVSNAVVHNCFWHCCPIHYRRPKSRAEFWKRHIEDSNRKREIHRKKLDIRWHRIWEHEVRSGLFKRDIERLLKTKKLR